jgi:hypothetical protein
MKISLLFTLVFSMSIFNVMAGEVVPVQFEQKDGKWIYAQDFNSLWKTSELGYANQSFAAAADYWVKGETLPGWYLSRYGSENAESFRMDNGAHYTAAAFYSYGYVNVTASTSPEKADTTKTDAECQDRSLGSVTNVASGTNHFMGVVIKNNTGANITKLEIDYTGHLWKGPNYAVETRAEKLEFSYAINPTITLSDVVFNNHDISDDVITGTAVTELDFVRPEKNDAMGVKAFGKMDGRASQNMSHIVGTIDVVIPAGQTILLRWKDTAQAGESHNYGKAIDNLKVTATASTTGVKSTFNSQIKVFTEKTDIVVESNGNEKITVYTLSGAVVKTVQKTSDRTLVSNLETGRIYIVKVGVETFKICL